MHPYKDFLNLEEIQINDDHLQLYSRQQKNVWKSSKQRQIENSNRMAEEFANLERKIRQNSKYNLDGKKRNEQSPDRYGNKFQGKKSYSIFHQRQRQKLSSRPGTQRKNNIEAFIQAENDDQLQTKKLEKETQRTAQMINLLTKENL